MMIDTNSTVNTLNAHNTYSHLVKPLTYRLSSDESVQPVDLVTRNSQALSLNREGSLSSEGKKLSFQDYILDAVKSVNQKQLDVSALQEKLITNPDEVDIHDVTIAMSKAQLSLNMAQTVIDRLVQGWSEITTTR